MATVSKDVEDGKMYAFLAIFLTIIGFIIVLATKKDNQYAMFYAKQGLVLFIAYVAVQIVNVILGFLPGVLDWIISMALSLGVLVLWIIGIVYSLSGEMKDIPIIGLFAKKINL